MGGGGIAGHLLATGVLAALVRAKGGGEGCCVEVSLLGAALAVQIQDLVWLDGEAGAEAVAATEAGLVARAEEIGDALALDPYYRCFGAADGYLAVACLNIPQRRAFLDVFELEDPTIAAPDIVPDDPAELAAKRVLTAEIEWRIAVESVETWLARLGAAGVPCGPVLERESVHADSQVRANDLVQTVEQPGLGYVTMLGRVFRVDGADGADIAPAPALGADTDAVLAELDG